jgi:hypothetical protein
MKTLPKDSIVGARHNQLRMLTELSRQHAGAVILLGYRVFPIIQ